MDITAFLTRRGQISLQAMLCAYGFLSESQNHRGFVEYDEIHQGLRLGADLSAIEVDVHSLIIYESAIIPIQFSDRPRKLKFHVDGDGITSFIKNIMRTIQRKTQGKFSHSLDNFKRDIDHHFTQEIASLSMQVPNTLGFSHRAPIENNCAIKHGSSVYPKYGQGPTYAGSSYNEMDTGINKDLFENPSNYLLQKYANQQISEQGIRFLAEIRRGGMDILFPQIKHDKVLSIIFAVFTLVKSTAHKELIDLVMAVKDCGAISNLENVSKTKVRGVIALLKLAAIIETHGGSTEKSPVNLTLSLTIDSYETLREQHDEFLSNFGATQPVVWRDELYWGKLIWGRIDDKRRVEKLKEMEIFMPNLLKSSPMRPIVILAGPSKTGEIFLTKEAALENTNLYDSFNFKFDIEKDNNNNNNNNESNNEKDIENINQNLSNNNNNNNSNQSRNLNNSSPVDSNTNNNNTNSMNHGILLPGSNLIPEGSSGSSYNGRTLDPSSPTISPFSNLSSVVGAKKDRTPLVSMGVSGGPCGAPGIPSFLFNLEMLNNVECDNKPINSNLNTNINATANKGNNTNNFISPYQHKGQREGQGQGINTSSPLIDPDSSSSLLLAQTHGHNSVSDHDNINNNHNGLYKQQLQQQNNINNNNINSYHGLRSSQLTQRELQELRGRRPTMIELGQLHQTVSEPSHGYSLAPRRHSLGDGHTLGADPSSYDHDDWKKLDIFAAPQLDESDPKSLAQYRRHQQALMDADTSHNYRDRNLSYLANQNDFNMNDLSSSRQYSESNSKLNLSSRSQNNNQAGLLDKMWVDRERERERGEESYYDSLGRSKGSHHFQSPITSTTTTSSHHFDSLNHQCPTLSYPLSPWEQHQQQQQQRSSFDDHHNLQQQQREQQQREQQLREQREQQYRFPDRFSSASGGHPSSFPSRVGSGNGPEQVQGQGLGQGQPHRPLSSVDIFNSSKLKQQQQQQLQQHLLQQQQLQQLQHQQAMISPRGFTSISPGTPNIPYTGTLERDDSLMIKQYQLPQQQYFPSNSYHN